MIDQIYIELIHREIDGLNVRDETLKLKAYLEAHPEARKLYDEFMQMSSVLNRIQDREPPRNLHRDIMRSIRESKVTERGTTSFLRSLVDLLPRIRYKRYASAFSMGLLAGIVIYTGVLWTINRDRSVNMREFYGTFSPKTITDVVKMSDPIRFDLEEMQGDLHYWFSQDRVHVELEMASQTEIDLVFSFLPEDLALSGFSRKNEGQNYLHVRAGSLELTHAGTNTYTFSFFDKSGKNTYLKLQARTFDSAIFEKMIPLKNRKK